MKVWSILNPSRLRFSAERVFKSAHAHARTYRSRALRRVFPAESMSLTTVSGLRDDGSVRGSGWNFSRPTQVFPCKLPEYTSFEPPDPAYRSRLVTRLSTLTPRHAGAWKGGRIHLGSRRTRTSTTSPDGLGTQDCSNGNVGRAGSLIWLSSSGWPPENLRPIEGIRRGTNR